MLRRGDTGCLTRYRRPVSGPRVPGGVVHKLPGDLRKALIANRRRSMPGRTSHPWPATSSSAGSTTPSRRRLENGAFVGPRRSWRKASVGPAAGQGASTASAPAIRSSSAPTSGLLTQPFRCFLGSRGSEWECRRLTRAGGTASRPSGNARHRRYCPDCSGGRPIRTGTYGYSKPEASHLRARQQPGLRGPVSQSHPTSFRCRTAHDRPSFVGDR